MLHPTFSTDHVDGRPPPSSPSIYDLPAELLDDVCANLRPTHLVAGRYPLRADYTALYSLCLTSKRLLSAALPHLYWSLVLGPPSEGLAAALEASDDVVEAVSSSMRHLHLHPFATYNEEAEEAEHRNLARLFMRDAANLLQSLTLQLSGDEIVEQVIRPLEALQGSSPVAPKRIFVKHYGSRLKSNMGQLLPLTKLMSNLTHLHLSGPPVACALLYPACAETYKGPAGSGMCVLRFVAPHLTHLRLSLLPAEALTVFQDFVDLRTEMSSKGLDITPQDARSQRGHGRVNEAKSVLFDIATEVGQMKGFSTLSLELSALMRLDEPAWAEDLRTRRAPGMYAAVQTGMATGSGPIDAPYIEETLGGQLVSMDFPSDVIIDGSAATHASRAELEREAERNRTAFRDDYWMAVRNGKEALKGVIAESASRRIKEEEDAEADGKGKGVAGRKEAEQPNGHAQGVEVRVCAPRSSGWNLHEVEREHWANIRAVEGIPPLVSRPSPIALSNGSTSATTLRRLLDDLPCFEDEDMFVMAERDPHFGYERVQSSFSGPTRWWWTGEFPRVNAGA